MRWEIRICTISGAYPSFEENIKGSIEVGKLADLAVLGADPTRVDPMIIKDIRMERTIMGGVTIRSSAAKVV